LWTTDQANASHDGYQPVSLDVSRFRKQWEHQVSDLGLDSQVVAGNGHVYVTAPREFMALKLADGTKSWSHEYFRGENQPNAPAYTEDALTWSVGEPGHGQITESPPNLVYTPAPCVRLVVASSDLPLTTDRGDWND